MRREKYLEIRKDVSFKIRGLILFEHFVIDAVLLSFSRFFWTLQGGFQFLAIPLISIFILRSFSLMHEAAHGLILQNKNLNDLVGLFAGACAGLPFESWKKSHSEHHYWSGNIDKDPVLAIVKTVSGWSPRIQSVVTFFWKAWVPVLTIIQNSSFWSLGFQNALRVKTFKNIASLVLPVVLWGSVIGLSSAPFLWQILLPAYFFYLVASEVVNLPHHLQLPKMKAEQRLPLWDQHVVSRTCLYSNWFGQFAVLNFNLHSEHHMYPDIPWYHLPEIHTLVQKELKTQQHLDPSLKWIFENRTKSVLEVMTDQPSRNARSGNKIRLAS